jgi:hypothetical protein
MITDNILQDLKSFEWQEIINKGNQLEDLNDRQWRFMKGLVAELIIEKHSGPNGLVYVGEDHKDYDWPHHGLTVELKSGLSGSMYGKKGKVQSKFNIKFNNSNGTNKKDKLDPNEVADILLVVKNDGAFAVDKNTVISRSKKGGDGFDVHLYRSDIIEITGKMSVNNAVSLDIKKRLEDAIRQAI